MIDVGDISVLIKRCCAILCLVYSCIAPGGHAQARSWQALYCFGDSYTDSGAGYLDADGPTAVVYLAAGLKIPFTYAGAPDSSGKSLNFAVSDAKTGSGEGYWVRPASPIRGIKEARLGLGMRNQVQDFVARVRSGAIRFNGNTTIFFLAGGLNDSALPTATTITNLEDEIRQLYAAGGRYFLVALLPTRIPEFSDVGIRLNPALSKIPAELAATLPQAHIALSKWGAYYDDVIENPARYGLLNTTNLCAGRALFGEDPAPCSSPDKFFYFHDGHPSTAAHRAVAHEMEGEITEAFR